MPQDVAGTCLLISNVQKHIFLVTIIEFRIFHHQNHMKKKRSKIPRKVLPGTWRPSRPTSRLRIRGQRGAHDTPLVLRARGQAPERLGCAAGGSSNGGRNPGRRKSPKD